MNENYGLERVLEPKHVLPTCAWKVDNSREISAHEMRVAIKRVHIEPTSFKQICLETGNNDERIKQKIMDIVIRRGKLHNPVTDTGGVLYGVVEEIGEQYRNPKGLKPGDEVVCNVSLACIPTYISNISKLDKAYTQIDAEGYAIVSDSMPIVRKPEGVPMDLMLFVFNESGSLYRVSSLNFMGKRVLIVGNNMLMNIIFGYAVRRTAGENVEIVCLFDRKTDIVVKGKTIDMLVSEVFDEVHYLNILHPMECISKLNADSAFDVSINCADIPGAETINVLATRSGGSVFFANLINNYNVSLYITEVVAKQLNLRCAEGYLAEYEDFDTQLVKELAPYLKAATVTEEKANSGRGRVSEEAERLYEASGHQSAAMDDFVYKSHAMQAVMEKIISVAKYDCNVLINGDTGVGKEKVANMIQKNSRRNMQPFVKINCAAIAPNLMESEFFGYEKGSFTGASHSGKKGYFEAADNGIIFLDEVGELPLDIQAKLLRIIQEGEFFRVGGTTPVKCDVRIISATNRNLEEEVEKGSFRRDLYYRLNVFPIRVPSLAERRADIPPLVKFFLKSYGEKFGIKREIEEDAIESLQQMSWPGNIRELENTVQRLIIGAKGESITVMDVMKEKNAEIYSSLGKFAAAEMVEEETLNLEALVDSYEKQIIKYACDKYGSTRKAAKAIGISQTQLVRKKKKYDI